jgi:hypothetical protein
MPWYKDSQWWQTIVAAILVPFAIYAVVVYSKQLSQMRKATRAATHATSLATLNSHLDLRAWVAPVFLSGKPEPGRVWTVTIETQNSGKTFGKKFEIIAIPKIKELADPDPDFEKELRDMREKRPNQGQGVIAPGGQFAHTAKPYGDHNLTGAQLEYIKSPTVLVLVFGKITYSDVFGCDHWTTFCGKWHSEDDSFSIYGPYNDADNNCGPKTK